MMLMTAYGTIEIAVEAMKRGAIDFITKPFPHDGLRMKIEKVLDYRAARRDSVRLGEQNRYLRDEIDGRYNFGEIIGQSVQMYAVLGAVRKVAILFTVADSSAMTANKNSRARRASFRAPALSGTASALPLQRRYPVLHVVRRHLI